MENSEIAKIYKELYPNLFRYAQSLTKNKDDAHDLTMEVLASTLERLQAGDEVAANLKAFLIRSIRNRFIDNKRKYGRVGLIDDCDGYLEPIDEQAPSDPFMKKRIANAYSKLSETCQETLALIAQGWKYDEIKELKNVSKNSVAGSVYKCREKFSNYLYGKERKELN